MFVNNIDDSLSELFPALLSVAVGLMGANSQASVEAEHTLGGPRSKISEALVGNSVSSGFKVF